MRILVADQNALLLAAITATFGKHCDLVTATRRDVCMAYVEQEKFDVVVACDKMADYTGLELLSEVGTISPGTLLIFAASPERLERLSYRLQVFGLLDTLAYPITPRKLLNALRRAREHLPSRAARKVRHVVLESEWDTGERLALVEKDLDAAIARHSSGIGESDWVDEPAGASTPTERARSGGGADAGSLGNDGVEEFVFAAPPCSEDAIEPPIQVPATQDRWEFSELEGFVYESAEGAVIEVMPAEVPVACAEEQVDYEAVGNDSTFDAPEWPSWAEDGAANDVVFGAEPTQPTDNGSGQTLSATLTSGGSWSVNPQPALPVDVSPPTPPAKVAEQDAAAPPAGQPCAPSATAAKVESPPAPPASVAPGSTTSASARSKPTSKRSPQPRTRSQSVPTESQRAAFERARARRNAERAGLKTNSASDATGQGRNKGGTPANQRAGSTAASSTFTRGGSGSSKSLSELARMATRKRPLAVPAPGKSGVPKRAVFAVGSGLAAVILLGVLSFELFRPDHSAVAQQRPAQVTSSHLFSPTTTALASQQRGGAAQLVPPQPNPAPPPSEPFAPPVPQNFDPNTAPPDPPPPPPVEQPGPMEPPPPPWVLNQQQQPPPGTPPADPDAPPIFQ